ncbi:MAG: glycoside hydrolase family 1 protein [Candidatus Eisenbacteria bacterium]|uniref:Glycoside hydrolase family 1 protein n=1 Tax=Eiseniibacteriota bacterium TaxID=2212470 RepID=A0A538UA70_UNCEI|nr:MAG: glycoside hydrolase family 1 protein [Candidatus Eisenbacteria bacterium]
MLDGSMAEEPDHAPEAAGHEPVSEPGAAAEAEERAPEVPVMRPDAARFSFPERFLWGTSTSAQQVEGNITNNDWSAWEDAGRVSVRSGLACDHYHRFRGDFDLAHDLAHNAHRFSLEWSRIEPEENRFSEKELQHYREVIEALRTRGLEPIVTIHHYTFPRWLAEKGGWDHGAIERYYVRYVSRVVDAYKDLVRWWITLNEPIVQVFKGWIIGQWPPGRVSDYPRAMVSVAKHCLALTPNHPHNPFDWISTRTRGFLFNELFLDALQTGRLALPGQFFERLPFGRTLDFIGINYYTRDFVRNTGLNLPGLVGTSGTLEVERRIGKRNDLGWEVYPEGLGHFLRDFHRYRLPLLITENGIPAVDEDDRWGFIYLHLWQVMRAMATRIPVVGYLYWSLLDNYEWTDGYSARFGLIGVNFKTQERIVRPSGRWLAELIRKRSL